MNASYYRPVPSEQDLHQNNSGPQETPAKVHVSKFHAFDLDNGDNHPGLPARTTTRRPIRHAVHVNWVFEVVCWLFASGCFVAIAAILFSFDGQPVPNWEYGITLATVVSLLSSLGTFALVVPLEAGMGQLKWLWFRKTRPIADFESIESAALGPPGSAKLLVTGKGGVLAWFGALLIVLVLAISPFVQQIITSGFWPVYKPEASLPFARSYFNDSLSADVDLPMKAAINSGILVTGNTSGLYDAPRHCPTGNCTFPTYTTLGVCGSCADLTKSLIATNITDDGSVIGTNYSLPNGLWMNADSIAIGITMSISTPNASFPSISFENTTTGGGLPLVDVFTVIGHYTADGFRDGAQLDMGPYASECVLQFCIKTFATTVSNGTLQETLVDTPVQYNSGNSQRDVNGGPDNAAVYFNTVDGTNYTVGDSAMTAFWNYMPNLFSGQVAQYNTASGSQSFWPDDLTQAFFVHLNSTPHTLDAMFNNIADSMTLKIRTENGAGIVQGDARYLEAIVVIRWEWISLPLAILLLALVFLIIVAVRTRMARLEPWKTGALPTLFALHGLNSQDEMEQKAKQLYVQLNTDDSGYSLRTMHR